MALSIRRNRKNTEIYILNNYLLDADERRKHGLFIMQGFKMLNPNVVHLWINLCPV